MMNLITRLRAFARNEEAQDLIEYTLLVGLISLVAVVAIDCGRWIGQRHLRRHRRGARGRSALTLTSADPASAGCRRGVGAISNER